MNADALPPCVGGAAQGGAAVQTSMTVDSVQTALALPPTLPIEMVPFGKNTEAGTILERDRFRRCLITQTRMLACWGAECFPAAPGEKIHFARALMESAAQEMAQAVGIPYPVEAAEPAANLAHGLVKLLETVLKTLTNLNGVFARDSDESELECVVDVIGEIAAVEAMLASIRGVAV
jgi:hypothetical protein